MYRDFESYLYDPTFSAVPLRFEGPWPDTPENRGRVEALLSDVRIENGFRLLVLNLELPEEGLFAEFERARAEVERLLKMMSGLRRPASGRVDHFGKRPRPEPATAFRHSTGVGNETPRMPRRPELEDLATPGARAAS